MHQATSDAEREHVRECQTDSRAPYQSEHVPGDGSDILQGSQRGDQADGHIKSHGPALFAQMVRIQVVGTDRGRDGALRGVFGHNPILARCERLFSAAIAGTAA
jgi:hypothetical protein